jgi:hypothetical protein
MDEAITLKKVLARVTTAPDVEPALPANHHGLWSATPITAGQFVMTMRRLVQALS